MTRHTLWTRIARQCGPRNRTGLCDRLDRQCLELGLSDDEYWGFVDQLRTMRPSHKVMPNYWWPFTPKGNAARRRVCRQLAGRKR